jgi:DNA repair photolyase
MIPYAINNLYGDPALQFENTIDKLKALSLDPWTGPVGLITKGAFDKDKVTEIKGVMPKHLVVFVSISSLEIGGEPVSVSKRLQTIKNFSDQGIPVIGYARPLTSDRAGDVINQMYDSGATTVVVSGFRGTTELGNEVGVHNPNIQVKLMTLKAKESIEKCNKRVFHRTACGAAYALGLKRSWNPYWKSPQLAGCFTCPLKETCFDQPNVTPNKTGLKVLQNLGYSLEKQDKKSDGTCNITSDNRTSCKSCCTTCFHKTSQGYSLSREDNKIPNLGELSFARHILGGVQVYSKNVIDGGDPAVGNVEPPRKAGMFKSNRVRALNTWLSLSNQVSKCYGCKYCFAPYYSNELGEYGILPSQIMELGK